MRELYLKEKLRKIRRRKGIGKGNEKERGIEERRRGSEGWIEKEERGVIGVIGIGKGVIERVYEIEREIEIEIEIERG